jgi:hypothetical protein
LHEFERRHHDVCGAVSLILEVNNGSATGLTIPLGPR